MLSSYIRATSLTYAHGSRFGPVGSFPAVVVANGGPPPVQTIPTIAVVCHGRTSAKISPTPSTVTAVSKVGRRAAEGCIGRTNEGCYNQHAENARQNGLHLD